MNCKGGTYMQPLTNAEAGGTYTVKWIFGIPEIVEFMHSYQIDQGSCIRVIQKLSGGLIIGTEQARLAISSDVAERIKI